jgi:hypothetical protein
MLPPELVNTGGKSAARVHALQVQYSTVSSAGKSLDPECPSRRMVRTVLRNSCEISHPIPTPRTLSIKLTDRHAGGVGHGISEQ